MVLRTLFPAIILSALIASSDGTKAGPDLDASQGRRERRTEKLDPNRWVAMVVTRITQAGGMTGTGGTVTIRVRIGIDGTLEAATVEASSGSPALDARVLQAARTAAPFAPPPETLLTLEGFTELSFPVDVARPKAPRP